MSGVWMWIAARDGNHIGFSGVIYALAAFIFFSGLFRRYYRLMALSGIVVFLYGSMIWGVLPIQPSISWEGHLFGAIAGIILAFYYRQQGPQRPKYSWEFDDYEEVDFEADMIAERKAWLERQQLKSPEENSGTQIRYFIKKDPPSSDSA